VASPITDKRARNLVVISKSISHDEHQTAVTKVRLSWESRDAIDHAQFYSRSLHAPIRVYDDTGSVIETHKHAGKFKGVVKFSLASRRTSR
jgi:hypothetical protein